MYLNKIVIENVGPFEQTTIAMPFAESGDPKPLVLVGVNGSGKTIFLAHVVDALHEFAVKHFQDVLPHEGIRRSFFKVSGAANRRMGTQAHFCFLEFKDGDDAFQYLDKDREITFEKCREKLGDQLKLNQHQWKEDKLTTDSPRLETILNDGVFAYFPTGRSEWPHWLNSENTEVIQKFGVKRRFRHYFGKPFVVASTAKENTQWLLDVLLDHNLYKDTVMWENANQIIRAVLQRPKARFGVGPRIGGHRIAIAEDPAGNVILPSIDHLSAGQSTLLNLCLTVLRYGDRGRETDIKEMRGIVLIDEVDAHLHINLLHQALPNVIKFCPKIQFILTTHSPVFLLGMEAVFGNTGFVIAEMPSGKKMAARDFSEYSAVMNVLDITAAVQRSSKGVVLFVEGQTDKQIIENAWKKLNPAAEPVFEVVNAYDCFAIQNAMSREDIFKNSPATVFIGMLDFDRAFECWERLRGKNGWTGDAAKTEREGLLIKHANLRGFVFLLPVPEYRRELAGQGFGKDSVMSIEFLFEDRIIGEFLREEKLPGGGRKPVFRDDKKQEFADMTSNLAQADFEAFKPVFALIDQIAAQTIEQASSVASAERAAP